MYVFVHHIIKNERVKVMINDDQCVMDLVEYVGNYFKQISIDNIDENDLTLQYDGCILNESWLFKDINILPGSTLKCFPREINEPDFYVYIKVLKETYQYFHNKTDLRYFSVFDLRVKLSEEYGFPLTIFRLRFDAFEKDLLDTSIIIDYGIKRHSQLTLGICTFYMYSRQIYFLSGSKSCRESVNILSRKIHNDFCKDPKRILLW
jgi:hypothetical protein